MHKQGPGITIKTVFVGRHLKCRVKIYYRAIGRPWGPAAIVSVKFQPPLQSARAGPLAGDPGRPRAVGATPAFKFESGRQRA